MPRLKANLVSVYVVRPSPAGLDVLLLQRPAGHRFARDWQGVHGHIEPGETAWEAALRELREETGLVARRWFRLHRLESFYNPDNDSLYFVPVFIAEVDPQAECVTSEEHAACEWRPPAAARTRLSWETQRESLDALARAAVGWPGSGVLELDLEALQRTDRD